MVRPKGSADAVFDKGRRRGGGATSTPMAVTGGDTLSGAGAASGAGSDAGVRKRSVFHKPRHGHHSEHQDTSAGRVGASAGSSSPTDTAKDTPRDASTAGTKPMRDLLFVATTLTALAVVNWRLSKPEAEQPFYFTANRWTLGVFFAITGYMHFHEQQYFLNMMPREIPLSWHKPLLYATGVLIAVSGLMVLVPPPASPSGAAAASGEGATGVVEAAHDVSNLGAWLCILCLVIVYPANINCLRPEVARRMGMTVKQGFMRLPVQLLFGAWAYLAASKSLEGTWREWVGGPE